MMNEPMKPEPGEKLGFTYDKKTKQIHYTESPTHIEVRLLSLVDDSPPELMAVVDKATHKIEEGTVVVTLWAVPIADDTNPAPKAVIE